MPVTAALCQARGARSITVRSSEPLRPLQALEGLQSGPLEQVPIQDYFPKAQELSPVEFAA